MKVPAKWYGKYFSCSGDTPFPYILFVTKWGARHNSTLVNLIILCVDISSLSVLVFYLPAYSGEKDVAIRFDLTVLCC